MEVVFLESWVHEERVGVNWRYLDGFWICGGGLCFCIVKQYGCEKRELVNIGRGEKLTESGKSLDVVKVARSFK